MNRNHLAIALVMMLSLLVSVITTQPFIFIIGLLGIVSVVMGKQLANVNS